MGVFRVIPVELEALTIETTQPIVRSHPYKAAFPLFDRVSDRYLVLLSNVDQLIVGMTALPLQTSEKLEQQQDRQFVFQQSRVQN